MSEGMYSQALTKGAKKNQVVMIITLVITLAIVGVVGFLYVSKEVLAPELTGYNQIMSIKKGTIVKVTTNEHYYTGYTVQNLKTKKDLAWYYFIRIDEEVQENGEKVFYTSYLTVRNRNNYLDESPKKTHTFKGVLRDDPFAKANVGVFAELANVSEEEAAAFMLPLEVTDDYDMDYLWVAALAAIPLVFFFLILSSSKTNRKNKEALAQYTDAEAADLAFSQEFDNINNLHEGNLTLHKDWIFNKQASDTYLFPSTEVMWVYKTITQHRYNGIPTGKTYGVNFCLSNKIIKTFASKESNIDDIIDWVTANWLGTYVGFNEEMRQDYATNFDGFLAHWQQNKKIKTV